MKQNILKVLRAKRNWSQEAIASEIGISVPAYSKIENGLTDVNLSRLKEIASALGIEVYNLLKMMEKGSLDIMNEVTDAEKIISEQQKEIDQLRKKVINLQDKIISSNN